MALRSGFGECLLKKSTWIDLSPGCLWRKKDINWKPYVEWFISQPSSQRYCGNLFSSGTSPLYFPMFHIPLPLSSLIHGVYIDRFVALPTREKGNHFCLQAIDGCTFIVPPPPSMLHARRSLVVVEFQVQVPRQTNDHLKLKQSNNGLVSYSQGRVVNVYATAFFDPSAVKINVLFFFILRIDIPAIPTRPSIV